ncbi:tail fiber assembly protein [Citrobacter youngae]|uniref:tail fiber assembly protein n=1 Tax=Citrobacter youngae TaxID=133448 RepID=UPI0019173C41|nr:tail fiber assembly protein [Citrobacter youngae]MBK6259213.1 tail fiber assembly protein [Citrobacter youngae]
MKLYSKLTGGFYDVEINGDDIPQDAVEINDDTWMALLNGQAEGKIISPDENGYPVLTEPPPLTQQELIAQAELKKRELRIKADSEISWRQDAVDAGIATEEETAALTEWKKYRVMLMRVNPEKPEWPPLPGEQAS